jgi:hypothetical protein
MLEEAFRINVLRENFQSHEIGMVDYHVDVFQPLVMAESEVNSLFRR